MLKINEIIIPAFILFIVLSILIKIEFIYRDKEYIGVKVKVTFHIMNPTKDIPVLAP